MSESGGLKLGKVRLTQGEMDAIEGGERLQDVHILQLQFPEKAGFQSTIYISAMVEQRLRRKELYKYTLTKL